MSQSVRLAASASLLTLIFTVSASAQGPAVIERVTFDEAVRRAIQNNPGVAEAAQAILRADALLQQANTVRLPTMSGAVTTTTLDTERGFEDVVTQPRTQTLFNVGVSYPVLAAARWAERAQAQDQIRVAQLGVTETRRQIALATAQTYLDVIAQQRQVTVNERARENARAHVEYAQALVKGGAGSRLNELRALQELATDEVFLESSRLALLRSQEALGVLMAADGPVDAAAEPALEVVAVPTDQSWLGTRPDVQLFTAQVEAANRVFQDSWRDWVPTATASFEPQYIVPSSTFAPSRSWRALVFVDVPIFDAGDRRIAKLRREIDVDTARIQLTDVQIRARSEMRTAQAAVESTERGLQQARQAAQFATEVLKITDVAFRAGATTNIELIDAQRQARDADTAAAQAEDRVRQARLDLLVALGRFPG
jgi:outer membrane protein TolC